MYAISNSLAKAKLNQPNNLIEVTFKGYAIPQIYQETLDIIQEIGLSNELNNWVFNKENFSGILASDLLNYIVDWAKKGHQRFEKQKVDEVCKVLIVAHSPLLEQLNCELSTGNYRYPNIIISVNSSQLNVNKFFKPKTLTQKVLQRVKII